MKTVQQLRKQQKGATVIEYALIAALIAVAAIAAFTLVGEKVTDTMGAVGTELDKAAPAGTP